jgi:cytoskeletal protein RodZ
MRRIVLLISAINLIAASCTSAPEATVEARSPVVSAGQMANSENNESAPTPQPDAPASTAPSSSDTTVPAAASTSTPTATNAPSATAALPQQAADNGDEPVGDADEPVGDEPVGDGPVLTSPAQAAGGNDPLAPVFFDFNAATATGCANADQGTVTLQWEVIGAESVSVAIGTDSQIFRTDEPPAGSLDVPFDCAASSTYFVIAANPSGRTVRSTTVAP